MPPAGAIVSSARKNFLPLPLAYAQSVPNKNTAACRSRSL